jgi:hypothetical protein
MAHQISKYPLATSELKRRGLPLPPEVIPVVFKQCGHGGQIFSPGDLDLEGNLKREYERTGSAAILDSQCFGCAKAKR